MVGELERVHQTEFPDTAPTANPVFYRTYSRKTETGRETWVEVCDRTINGLRKLGNLTPEETDLLHRMQSQLKALSSGRWLWVGGTEWITQAQNFSGAYNCSSTNIVDWRAFGLLMDLAMMGCGTGAVLETHYINQLPPIRNHLNIVLRGEIGSTPRESRRELTEVKFHQDEAEIFVGDSRQGWVGSYQALLELSTDERFSGEVKVIIDLSDVRPAGEPLKGFGGVANPVKLPELYKRCGNVLNKAVGRQLNSVECCVLIDEAAVTIVAGNIRRCLPEGALVHTASGLVPIEKIRIGDRVLTSKGFYPVTNFFDQGNQSLCRIHTEDGYFECTADHKVAVLQDLYGNYKMIKAKDLKEGDRLIFVPQAIPGTPTELPEFKGVTSSNAKPITIPALTSEVAYFLGYLHGNGSVASDGSQVSFRVSQDSPKILERLINVAQEFGVETHTLRTPEQCQTKAYELQLNSSVLNKYLSQFKQSSEGFGDQTDNSSYAPGTTKFRHSSAGFGDQTPTSILMGTTDIRQAYLAGLADADGCHSQGVLVASSEGFGDQTPTYHQNFLRQVQALYASLGITTRLCGSVRKRTGNWEGELVTVGESAFEAVEKVMMTYSTQFPVQKRKHPKSFKGHGFPKEMVRALVNTYQYHWSNSQKQMIAPTVKNFVADATDLIPVKVKKVEMDVREASTYDIEVASIHEFVCEGVLVSNSAGMRQGNSSDRLFAVAKDNLWQQDENGNWRIDPERDALRMANHTHVFHHKPTLEECVEAVRKQFYSGEGAIQWAGEAVARANRDLLSTPEIKSDFLKAYGEDNAKKWFQEHYPNISNDELEHRLARLGLNPCGEIIGSNFHCVAGDTLLITRDSIHKIKDVVGQKVEVWNGKKWSQVIPFKTGKDRKLYRVRFGDGSYLDVTEYHRFFVKDRFGKNYQEVQTKDLLTHSKYVLHTEPFVIDYRDGNYIDSSYAYTLGVAVGDGTLDQNGNAKIRLYSQKAELVVAGNKSVERQYNYLPAFVDVTDLGFSGELLRRLQTEPDALNIVASWNKPAILAFIAGLADTDGSNTKGNGIRIYLSDYERAKRLQLLLTKCGIRASVNLMASSGSTTNLGTRNKDLYYLQITDCREIPCQRLDTSKGCEPKFKGKNQVIQSVEELPGLHDTYCFEEPEFHKGVFGNTLTGNCNLSEIHLNQIDPNNYKEQEEAFTAGALSVATLLNHKFVEPRYRYSRELDPIVGVSFTGLFDFFVKAFGVDWLRWWQEGRPATAQGVEFKQQEAAYLSRWREIVHGAVWDYCDRHNLKRPNRCTTIQPSGTKSLLTNASPGWHPPFGLRWVRRITFGKNDPVALACLDYGYSVIPGQSGKDENGNLLNDPFDDRAKEWLVEIPVQVSWIDLPGVDEIEIENFSATAMFDFYMGVQQHWTTHNSSSTILLTEAEIEPLGKRIYEAIRDDEGYISSALLARFDAPFPRLPFEHISQEKYEKMQGDVLRRRKSNNFSELMNAYVLASELPEMGPQDPACSGMVCEMKGSEPEVK